MIKFILIVLIYLIFFIIYLKIFGFHPIKRIYNKAYQKIDQQDPLKLAGFYVFILMILLIGIGVFYNSYYNLNSDILAYSGSVIASGFTLLSLFMTISFTSETRKRDQELHEKERKEELELQYRPMLNFEVMSDNTPIYGLCNDLFVNFDHPLFNNNNLYTLNEIFKFTNVGRGEIQNINLKAISYEIVNSPSLMGRDVNIKKIAIPETNNQNVIPINGSIYLMIYIPTIDEFFENLISDSGPIILEISVSLSYKGVFADVFYDNILHFYLSIEIKDFKYSAQIYNASLLINNKEKG